MEEKEIKMEAAVWMGRPQALTHTISSRQPQNSDRRLCPLRCGCRYIPLKRGGRVRGRWIRLHVSAARAVHKHVGLCQFCSGI